MHPIQQPNLPGFELPVSRDLHNVFFALMPDEDTRAALAARSDAVRKRHSTNGRWIKPHRLHMTLQHIGEFPITPEAVIASASEAADRVRAKPFEIALDRIGSFRNTSIPWWIGCSEMPAELQNLWNAIAIALRENGFKNMKPLVPHITIVRGADAMIMPEPIEPLMWRIDEFRLIDSVLGQNSHYITRGTWRLSESA